MFEVIIKKVGMTNLEIFDKAKYIFIELLQNNFVEVFDIY